MDRYCYFACSGGDLTLFEVETVVPALASQDRARIVFDCRMTPALARYVIGAFCTLYSPPLYSALPDWPAPLL
jgi:hypothetical protein